MNDETIQAINEAEFERKVFKSPTPAVVDFYADWCPPCGLVSPILEQVAQEYEGTVEFLKVNVDDNPGLASRYGILSIPTVMFFSGETVMGSIIGASPAAAYRNKVKSLLDPQREVARPG